MKNFRPLQIGSNLWKIFSDDVKSARYRNHYTDASFWEKLKRTAKTAGKKLVYPALLLQYMMKADSVPLRIKLVISAALGYFILPIDFIPDFAPLLGFTDDLGVILLILRQMAVYITPDIRKKAREHLAKWFGETSEPELELLDQEMLRNN